MTDSPLLNLYTEEYPPFNYTSNGHLTGISVELVEAILEQADLGESQVSYHVYPWGRAYQLALRDSKGCIFTTARLPEREHRFQWLAELMHTEEVLIGKKDRFQEGLNKSNAIHYVVGVVKVDKGLDLVRALGWPFKYVYAVTHHQQLLKMMAADRLDLWAADETLARALLVEANIPGQDYIAVASLGTSAHYLACNLKLPVDLKGRLQTAYRQLKERGVLQAIMQRHRDRLGLP